MDQCARQQKMPAVHSTYLKRKNKKHGYKKFHKKFQRRAVCHQASPISHEKIRDEHGHHFRWLKVLHPSDNQLKMVIQPSNTRNNQTDYQFKFIRVQNIFNLDTFPCMNSRKWNYWPIRPHPKTWHNTWRADQSKRSVHYNKPISVSIKKNFNQQSH